MKIGNSLYGLTLFLAVFVACSLSLVSCKSDKSADADDPEQVDSGVVQVNDSLKKSEMIDTLTDAGVSSKIDSLKSQAVSESVPVQERLKGMVATFVDHCRKNRYWDAGKMMWYNSRRKNAERSLNDLRDKESDLKSLENESKWYRKWVGDSKDMNFLHYSEAPDSMGHWHIWTVEFVGAQTLDFHFLDRNGQIAIAEISNAE